MIDINELRDGVSKFGGGYLTDSGWAALIDRLEAAESSAAWHQHRWMALQIHQKKMREPERTIVCDIIANGELLHPTVAGDRYALPGAQPAPSVPDVDALAQFIREVDGSHQLGAGVLAERIAEWLKAAPEVKP